MLKRLTLVALALALLLAPGCAGKGTSGTTTNKPAEKPPADGTKLTRDTLPTQVGYAWETARMPGTGTVAVDLTVAGPWTLPAPGTDWTVTRSEIVDPATVPDISSFSGYDFVVKTVEDGTEYFYPRQLTDEWMQQLGKITVTNGQATAEPYEKPLRFWPVNFTVGQSFVVSDEGSFKIDAKVLAKNSVTLPFTDIPDAYLVRFDYTPLAEGAIEGSNYYLLAPNVGFVALFHAAQGDEQTGFTSLDSLEVLVSLPEKQ